MKNQNKTFLSYLPELYIAVSKDYRYLEFFGGVDERGYQNVEGLKGKGLKDFFSGETLRELSYAVDLSMEKNVLTEASYSMITNIEFGEHYYKAQFIPVPSSEVIKDELFVLMSVKDITNESLLIRRCEEQGNLSPFVDFPVMNNISYSLVRDEMFRGPIDAYELGIEIKERMDIALMVDAVKIRDVENHIARTITSITNNLDSCHVGRVRFGEYRVVTTENPKGLEQSLSTSLQQFNSVYVNCRNKVVSLRLSCDVNYF